MLSLLPNLDLKQERLQEAVCLFWGVGKVLQRQPSTSLPVSSEEAEAAKCLEPGGRGEM